VSELFEGWCLTFLKPKSNEDRLNELRDLAAQLSTDLAALDRRHVSWSDIEERCRRGLPRP
jgi:hypothetical protein